MRRLVGVILGVIVLFAAASAVWTYTSEEVRQVRLVISEVDGEVQLVVRGGDPAAARRGDVLAARDRVITGDNARVVLALGDDTRIRLGPTSSIQIQSVDDNGVQLELEDGALHATVRPEAGAVRVGNRGRQVIATNADFTMGVRDGVVQVDADRGSLTLSGVDVTRLDEGNQAIIVDQHADVGPVPETVLLEVEWPEPTRTRSEMTTITGVTAPGAIVSLTGASGAVVSVQADDEGRFTAVVPLAEGRNDVQVQAVDVLGNQHTVPGTLQTRDTVGPSFRGGVQYGP